MGLFASIIHLRDVEQNQVIKEIDKRMSESGYRRSELLSIPQSGPSTLPDHKKWMNDGKYYLVSPKQGNWVTIIESPLVTTEPYGSGLANMLSKTLSTYSLALSVHDSDIFFYNLDYKGVPKDGYNSYPQYFEDARLSNAKVKEQRHTPEEFQPILPQGVTMEQLKNILNAGWWNEFDTGSLGNDGAVTGNDEYFGSEENRMTDFGTLLQLGGKVTKYPYAFWDGSEDILWKEFKAIRYLKQKNSCMIFFDNEIQENSTYAQRFFSLCIDFSTFLLLALICTLAPEPYDTISAFTLIVWYIVWHKIFRKTGQTIGTKLMRIRVVPMYGSKLSFIAPFYRIFLSAPQFALFAAYENIDRHEDQSILDKVSHTYTIKLKNKIVSKGTVSTGGDAATQGQKIFTGRNKYRQASIQRLSKFGIKIPGHLPLIENNSELNPRSKDEVIGKICAFGYVIGMGYTDKTDDLIASIDKYKLWPYVSQFQAKCLKNPGSITKQDKTNFMWLAECVYAFAWCLKIVELDCTKTCPDNLADLTVPGHTPDEFMKNKEMRSLEEIQQEADFHYCLHWYEQQCRIDGKKGLVGEGVIWERRRALDWTIGVSNDWDDMPSDT
ncbi:MAG: DUF4272 domain-containing protein [Candidatus Brocadiia bacterium]